LDKAKYDESRAEEIRLATRAAENVDKVCDRAAHPIETIFPMYYTLRTNDGLRRVKMEQNYT
jgi:hypothetical protein